jgi:hypothetical protein
VDIFENTTSEVMNDSEFWKCSLAFNIPIRYNNEVRVTPKNLKSLN